MGGYLQWYPGLGKTNLKGRQLGGSSRTIAAWKNKNSYFHNYENKTETLQLLFSFVFY